MSEWFRSYGFADVHPGLLVGAYPLDSGDIALLQRMGVRRVINLAEDGEYPPGHRMLVTSALDQAGIRESRAAMEDHGELTAAELELAVSETVQSLRDGDTTYVHCRAGWQRSAAVAAGAVAELEQVDIREALALVNLRKPSARPLPHQIEDLLRWWEHRGLDPQPAADA